MIWSKECGLGPCSLSPCLNDGFCIELNASNYECKCPKNCHGINCESCTKGRCYRWNYKYLALQNSITGSYENCIWQLNFYFEGTRFQLDLEYPTLEFFKSSNSSTPYRGPKTFLGLVDFITEQMGRGRKPTKVRNYRITTLVLNLGKMDCELRILRLF